MCRAFLPTTRKARYIGASSMRAGRFATLQHAAPWPPPGLAVKLRQRYEHTLEHLSMPLTTAI